MTDLHQEYQLRSQERRAALLERGARVEIEITPLWAIMLLERGGEVPGSEEARRGKT